MREDWWKDGVTALTVTVFVILVWAIFQAATQ